MADPTNPTQVKGLNEFIKELLLEWDPKLATDPIKLKELQETIVQDFYAVAQTNPELLKQSPTALEPLLQFLTAKRLELHSTPALKPNPQQTIGKKCDELIKEICGNDDILEKELRQIVKENMQKSYDPANPHPKATPTLMNLFLLLKTIKNGDKNNLKPLRKFAELSEADRANIAVYHQKPDAPGSYQTTVTRTEPSPFVVQSLSNPAILLTVGAKMRAPNQAIDEADEIAAQNKEQQKYRTPFDAAKKPTPYD
jgi:hypothetical protein